MDESGKMGKRFAGLTARGALAAALLLVLGTSGTARGGEGEPVLPGTPAYEAQDVEELLQLAKCRDAREKAMRFAEFATRRVREAEAMLSAPGTESVLNLLGAYRILVKEGASVCLREGLRWGVDMREALATAARESARQAEILEKMAARPDRAGDEALRDALGLARVWREEIAASLTAEQDRVKERDARWVRTGEDLQARVEGEAGVRKETASLYRGDLLRACADHNDLHTDPVVRVCLLCGTAAFEEDLPSVVALSAAVNLAADRGMAGDQAVAIVRKSLASGTDRAGAVRILIAVAGVLGAGERETDPGRSAVVGRIAEGLLDAGGGVRESVKALALCRRARGSGMGFDEMGEAFGKEFPDRPGQGSDPAEMRLLREKSLERFQEDIGRQIEQMDNALQRAKEKMDRLEDWANKGRGKKKPN
jgi:hypothetical protein